MRVSTTSSPSGSRKPIQPPPQPLSFSYSLHWSLDTDKLSPNRSVATRIGADDRYPERREIAVDFTGPKFASLPEGVVPDAIVSCSANGTITEPPQVFQLPSNGVWRAIIIMEPKPGNHDPVDLRCTMQRGQEVLSETMDLLESALSPDGDAPDTTRRIAGRSLKNGTPPMRRWKATFTPCACATKCCSAAWSFMC